MQPILIVTPLPPRQCISLLRLPMHFPGHTPSGARTDDTPISAIIEGFRRSASAFSVPPSTAPLLPSFPLPPLPKAGERFALPAFHGSADALAIANAASGHGRLVLNRFDLALLKPVMPATTQASGIFSGNADVTWDVSKPGLPDATLQLSGKGVKVAQTFSNGALPLAFDTLNMNASLHNDIARLDWLIRLAN